MSNFGLAISLACYCLFSTTATSVCAAQARSGAWTLDASAGDWSIAGRDYGLSRFSPLGDITAKNVQDLRPVTSFSLGLSPAGGTPLVIGQVMYVATTLPVVILALDLSKPGSPPLWRHEVKHAQSAVECCVNSRRGLAYHPSGKLFVQLPTGELLALQATTGSELWRTPLLEPRPADSKIDLGRTTPIVIKDLVVVGISGGELGVRGRVAALDVATGRQVWIMYSTGPDKEVGITGDANVNYASHRGSDLGLSTWLGDEWKRGGGTTDGPFAYDPELNLLFYSTGGPIDSNPDERPGDNKWTSTIFARTADNGLVKWAYQMTPHDELGYSGENENVLFERAGQKLLAHFDRNGIAYTIDRTNGKLVVAQPYGPVNWAKRVDLTTGVPEKDPKYGTTSGKTGEPICPATTGFKDRQSAAYSPLTGLFYVPSNLACMDYEGVEVNKIPGQPVFQASLTRFELMAGGGRVIAWDAERGKVVWEITEGSPVTTGVVTTSGGLALYGTFDGWVKAADQRTGKLLWQYKTSSIIIGDPITFVGTDGQQYVAVLSVFGGWTGVGVAERIGAEDPTAGLGALGAFGDVAVSTQPGGALLILKVQTSVAAPDAAPRYIAKATRSASSALASGEKRLSPITVTRPGGQSERSFDARKVRELLQTAKAEMIAGMPGDELAGLRAYVAALYPGDRDFSTFRTEAHRVELAASPTVDVVLKEARDFVEKVQKAAIDLALDLEVATQPSGARFDLASAGGGEGRTTSTNSTMTNVYRGYYSYSVSRPGYKPVNEKLNLVDERETYMVCKLYLVGDTSGPEPCAMTPKPARRQP